MTTLPVPRRPRSWPRVAAVVAVIAAITAVTVTPALGGIRVDLGAIARNWHYGAHHIAQMTHLDFSILPRTAKPLLETLEMAVVGAAVALMLVLIAAIVVVAATLQLGMYARRDEIEIQKLVGATDLFVRVPYVLEGLLQGLLGAALAAGGLYLCHALLGPLVAQSLAGLGELPPQLSLTAPRLLGEVAAAGATLGVLGSTIAVGRFLRV